MAAVEGLSGTALARVLEAGRDAFNARFARARAGGAPIDAEAFLAHLRDVVAPIADAVESVRPERVGAVVDVAYDLSLQLMSSTLLGSQARHPWIARGWRDVAPMAPWLLATDPRGTLGSITNALHNLFLTDRARPAQWVTEMAALAPLLRDLRELRHVGHVVAWRCGMAHHRKAALRSCGALRSELALRALGIDGGDPARVAAALEALGDDPWLLPAKALASPSARELRMVGTVGAFRGFGGRFIRPPSVQRGRDGGLVATDGEGVWALWADVFGSVLIPLPSLPESVSSTPRFRVGRDGTVAIDDREVRFEGLAGSTSHAADETTLAVTIDQSHEIFLAALQ